MYLDFVNGILLIGQAVGQSRVLSALWCSLRIAILGVRGIRWVRGVGGVYHQYFTF